MCWVCLFRLNILVCCLPAVFDRCLRRFGVFLYVLIVFVGMVCFFVVCCLLLLLCLFVICLCLFLLLLRVGDCFCFVCVVCCCLFLLCVLPCVVCLHAVVVFMFSCFLVFDCFAFV